MVLAGQFLERPTLLESGGAVLEALWHRGRRRPALLICPPHPRRGGSMDAPVCAELAFAASHAGHPTLRFNYRGVGASQGPRGNLAACLEDAEAALALLRENTGGMPVVVAGYDSGVEVALGLAERAGELQAVALISPPPGCEPGRLSGLGAPGLVVVGEKDERVDRMALAQQAQRVGDTLAVIPAADVAFTAGLSALGREVARFLASYSPDPAPEPDDRDRDEVPEDEGL